jgi:hypothetical protein
MENSQKPPRVAIILLNWNSRMDTLECLESVFRLNYPDFRVVVCDNNSSDGSLDSIQEWAQGHVSVAPASKEFDWIFTQTRPKQALDCVRYTRAQVESLGQQQGEAELVLIETGANLGFSGGNNVGIRYALKHLQPDYLWLLNTDTLVDPDSLAALVERAGRSKTLGMVGSTLVYYWEPNKVQALGGASLDRRTTRMCHIGIGSPVDAIPIDGSEVESKMTYVVGASMLVSREFVEQIGPMCEDYFLYYEEIDWALRATGKFDVGYAPASRVFHKVGGASRGEASTASMRYLWRNRIIFVARFMPESMTGTLTTMAMDMVRAFLKGKFGLSRVIAEALLDSRQLIAEGKSNKASAQS